MPQPYFLQQNMLGQQGGLVGGAMGTLGTLTNSNATTEQKVSGVANLTLSFLLSLGGSNETAQVNSEISKNENQSQTIDDAIKTSAQKTQEAVDAVTEQIEANIATLEQLLSNIEAKEEEKQAYQKELENCQKIIEDNKAVLNNPNSTTEEKKEALNAITGVRTTIEDLTGKINDLASSIESTNEEVTSIGEQNEELNTQSVEVSEQGIQEQQGLQQQKEALHTENTVLEARGVADEGIGTAALAMAATLETAGSLSSGVPVVGAILGGASQAQAMKLQQIGTDYSEAGANVAPVVTTLVSNLTNMSGQINTNLTNFASIPTAIGSEVENANQVSYNYFDVSNSIGSFTSQASTLETQSENLEGAVEEAETKLNQQDENEEGSSNQGQVFGESIELGELVA